MLVHAENRMQTPLARDYGRSLRLALGCTVCCGAILALLLGCTTQNATKASSTPIQRTASTSPAVLTHLVYLSSLRRNVLIVQTPIYVGAPSGGPAYAHRVLQALSSKADLNVEFAAVRVPFNQGSAVSTGVMIYERRNGTWIESNDENVARAIMSIPH